MNYFAEDGPEPIKSEKKNDQDATSAKAKENYFKHFMVDFIEFNLRKVAVQNSLYCADRCKMFDNIMEED